MTKEGPFRSANLNGDRSYSESWGWFQSLITWSDRKRSIDLHPPHPYGRGHDAKRAATGRGPLLALFVLFADGAAAAELFRMVWWHGGVFCPDCELYNVIKYCPYQKHLQRYTCKDCCKTFNDKTGTILHYRHISIGNWMAAL